MYGGVIGAQIQRNVFYQPLGIHCCRFCHFSIHFKANFKLKLGTLHQNAKRYEARNTEREARRSHTSEREARPPLGRAP